jgi:hypothetical protein
MNATTGTGIAGATVQAGGSTATTDQNGRYSLQAAPGDRVAVNVRASGFAEGLSVASVVANATGDSTTRLLPLSTTGTISNAAGGTVSVPNSPAQVVLPAGAFGSSAGQVSVDLTVVNPAQDPSAMPGDFITSTGQHMESAGAIIVTPRDASGNVLQLAAGKSATIRIPLSTRGTATPTMPLFYLDTQTGSWVQEGTATLAGTAPNQYYEGTVTHFTAWNVDQVYNTIQVHGCVANTSNSRVAGARVVSDGIDYSGTASAVTDSNGDFVVPMKKAARAAITGIKGTQLTNSVSAGPSDTDITLPTCLVLSDTGKAVTMRLTWGSVPEDVDSHLFTPSGAHIWYSDKGSLTSEPFAELDVDDTTSFGPEVVTITKLMVGTYRYGLHNYSGETNPGMTGSPVRVELNTGSSVRVFGPPAGETSTTMFLHLFDFTVDAHCNITVTQVNQWETSVPSDPAPATPTFCTP